MAYRNVTLLLLEWGTINMEVLGRGLRQNGILGNDIKLLSDASLPVKRKFLFYTFFTRSALMNTQLHRSVRPHD